MNSRDRGKLLLLLLQRECVLGTRRTIVSLLSSIIRAMFLKNSMIFVELSDLSSLILRSCLPSVAHFLQNNAGHSVCLCSGVSVPISQSLHVALLTVYFVKPLACANSQKVLTDLYQILISLWVEAA